MGDVVCCGVHVCGVYDVVCGLCVWSGGVSSGVWCVVCGGVLCCL